MVTFLPIMKHLDFQPLDESLNKMIDLAGIFLYLIIRRCSVTAAMTKKINKRS
jgi:hypothetical protein